MVGAVGAIGVQAVELRDVRSKPPSWLVDGLIPQGHITLLFGRGGVGKTYLWLVIASHIAAGRPLFGRHVMQGKTLILDAELDPQAASYRARQVAAGMGLKGPPKGLVYARLNGSIFEAPIAKEIRELIKEHKPLLVVVDALSSAAPESDPTEAVAARKVLTDLLSLGTTILAIDHISKAAISRDGDSPTPLGSVAKENLMRSGLHVKQHPDGTLRLYQTKSTFGERMRRSIALRVTIKPEMYRIEEIEPDDQPDRQGSSAGLKARIVALLAEHPDGLPAKLIRETLGATAKNTQNRLAELKSEGLVQRTGQVWLPT